MSLKLHVGFSKKLGLPDYGSMGATCGVELELDGSLLQSDLETFQKQVRHAYSACAQAVNDELAKRQQTNGSPRANSTDAGTNGRKQNGQYRRATQSQLRAINTIADREGVVLAELLQARFELDTPAELSISQASTLIDELKRLAQAARS